MLKKSILFLLCLVLAMSVLCIETFASTTINFDGQSGSVTFMSLQNGVNLFRNTDINLSNYSTTGNDPFGYEAGVYGKSSTDYSKTLRIHSAEGINVNDNSKTVYHTLESTLPVDGRYYEFLAAASGGAVIDVQVGGVILMEELTSNANWNSEGWNKVGLWFPPNETNCEFYIYLNGNEINKSNKTMPASYKRIRLRVTVPNGTNDAFAAFDNYYKSDPGLTVCPAYSTIDLASASGALNADSVSYPNPASMTVADLKNDISVGENVTASVYDPSALVVPAAMAEKGSTCATEYGTPKADSDTIAAGDKLILTKGGEVRVVTIANMSMDSIDFDNNDVKVSPKNNNAIVTSSKETNVSLNTTKAFKISAVKKAEDAVSAARVELNSLDTNSLLGNKKATIEFSMLATGAYNLFEAQCYYNDGTAKNKSLKIFQTDAQGIDTTRGINLDNKWIRVALTLDPENYSYDAYLNGDKVVDGGGLIHDNNNFSLARIGANIQPSSTTEAAILAIDDVRIYYGDYNYDRTITAPVNAYEDNKKIYAQKDDDYTSFINSVSVAEGDGKVLYSYQDGTYTQKSDSVSEGDILVITSADGLLRKYFTVTKNSELVLTNPVIDATDKISASCTAKYFCCDSNDKKNIILILAVYDGNNLIKAVSDSKENISTTGTYRFSVNSNEEAKNEISAKAFVWDTLNNLNPYVESVEYYFIEE